MSRLLPGEQIEHAFKANRLCNWEISDAQKTLKTTQTLNGGTLQARKGRTRFISDDRGYLIKHEATSGDYLAKQGSSNLRSSFNLNPQVYEKTPARWPQTTQLSSGGNPSIPMVGRATMGYKGIATNYLPMNTVLVKSVEVPHNSIHFGHASGRYVQEYNYN